MNNSRLLELMSRKLSGEVSMEELQELEIILSTDTDAKDRHQLLKQFWEQHDNIQQSVIEEGLHKVLNRLDLPIEASIVEMSKVKTRATRTLWFRVSAAVVIVFIIGSLFFMKFPDKKDNLTAQSSLVEKQNSKGIKSIIVLTDGSKIWLNADSKIQYPKVFDSNTREVYLNGEAFFDVAKNPSRPFIIHLANGTVRVLGTSFNIRAYDNEKIVETSVATGKVAFIPKYERRGKKQDTVFLTPNNKVRYLFNEEEVIVEPTISKEDKAWTEGVLIFKAMSFEEIGVQLERNFDKKIVFLSDAPRQFKLTGSFQNNSLEEIMYYLSKSKDFTYKITSTEVVIH